MKSTSLLLLPFVISQASAFDAWGFHSSMSQEQAAAVAAREGFAGSTMRQDNPTDHFQQVVYLRKSPSGVDEIGYIAAFCNDRLYWLSHDYSAKNIGTLFELLNELSPVYGTPSAKTTSTVLTEGRARGINFAFPAKPNDVVSVSVNLTLQSDTAFSIQVQHVTRVRASCD